MNLLDERADFGEVTVLYGAKSPTDMLFKDEITRWAARDDVDFQMTRRHRRA